MDDIIFDFPRRPPWRRAWTRTERRVFVGWLAVMGAAFGLLPLVAESGPRDDVQVRANATTAGSQSAPAVAALPGGKVVVVWEGAGPGDDAGIFARIRYPDAGFGTDPEFLVNEVTDGTDSEPAVAADSAGNFLVAWVRPSAAADGPRNVFTRLFDSTGKPLRGEEVLNSETGGDHWKPAVTAVDVERFAVVYQGRGTEVLSVTPPEPVSPPAPVKPPVPVEPPVPVPVEPPVPLLATDDPPSPAPAGASDDQGIFLGYAGRVTEAVQVLVNGSHVAGEQRDPAVAASGSTVMVVWSGAGPGDDEGVFATTVSGTVADPQAFLVNTTTDGVQGEPAVVARGTNDFVAVWAGAGPGDSDGIFLRPLDRSVEEVLVNGVTDGDQRHPAVAVSGSGLLTVVWDGAGAGDADGIYARRFDPRVNIGPVATEIAVNTVTDGIQDHPAVAGSSAGDYTVAFESGTTDPDVFVRRFSVNDPPDVIDDAYTVDENGTVSGNVLANDTDVDGDRMTASTETAPTNGALTFHDDGTFVYRPFADFTGQDRFSYRASDGQAESVRAAQVVLTIRDVEDGRPPTAVDDGPYHATEDTQLTVSDPALGVLGNDTDPDPEDRLTAHLVDNAASGSLSLATNGTFTYVPNADFCGDDKFTYKASDGTSESSPAEAKLSVACVYHPPQARDDSYVTVEDVDLAVPAPGVLQNDLKKDSAQMVARLQDGPKSGALVSFNEDGSFTYRPKKDFHGTDSFTYAVADAADQQPPPQGSGQQSGGALGPATSLVPGSGSEPPSNPPAPPPPGPGQVATVTIEVGSKQDTPVATDDAYLTPKDTELVVGTDKGVLANDTDPDEGELTATLSTPPSRGKLVTFNPDGSFTYQPNQDFNGVDVFTYEAANQSGKSATGRVQLFVGPQGEVVIATDDRYQVAQDVSLTVPAPGVLTNDVDPDGDKLGLSVVKNVDHGKLELNQDGSFLYAPAEHFTGSDAFTYRVKDSHNNQATADVAIVVRPADKPPPDTTPTTEPGPVAPPPPPPPPPQAKIEIKTSPRPEPTAAPKPSEPVVPITVPRIAPPAPPTVALLPAEKKKGSGLPVKPLAAAGGGGLALAGLVAGLKSRRRLALGPVRDMPVD